jgi:hypothetical protein
VLKVPYASREPPVQGDDQGEGSKPHNGGRKPEQGPVTEEEGATEDETDKEDQDSGPRVAGVQNLQRCQPLLQARSLPG